MPDQQIILGTPEPLTFRLALSSDHDSPGTGLTPTVYLSRNGGAFAPAAGAVSEVGDGEYKVAPNAVDQGTVGPLLLHAEAPGCDPADGRYEVLAAAGDAPLIQGSTTYPLTFLLVSGDGVTGATGKSPTVTLSKAGGSFAAPAGAVAEIGFGLYRVGPAASDYDTPGPLALEATAAVCRTARDSYDVASGAASGLATWPTGLYCTDEDIAIRAGADWKDLVNKDMLLASGKDGTFLPSDRWTLTSPSVPDFVTQGVCSGMVATMVLPGNSATQRLGISTASAAGCTLRRLGQAASGMGQPPGAVGGTANINFAIATMMPQIREATYDLNRRYGVDDLVYGRRFSDEYDPNELKQACILTVLVRQCFAASRAAQSTDSGGQGDSWVAKAKGYKSELDELLARVVLHWKPAGVGVGAMPPPSTRFGTRLSR